MSVHEHVSSRRADPSRRQFLALAGGLGAGLAVAGCSSTAAQAPVAAAPGASGAFPRTLTTGVGDVVIPSAPQRVVCASDRMDLDAVLACGVQPTSFFRRRWYGLDTAAWTTALLDPSVESSTETGELSAEKILALGGDLLVTSPYDVEKFRDDLSKVMPVLTSGDTASRSNWSDQLALVARALGTEEQAARHKADVDQRLASLAKLTAGAKDLKVATLYGYSGSYGQEAGGSGTRAVLDTLGLHQPDRLRNVDTFSVELSLERIDEAADADVLLLSDWSSNPDDETTAKVLASKLFRQLPAVKAGRVVKLDVETTVGAYMLSALSIVPVAEKLSAAVLRAADGKGDDLS